MTNSPVAGLHSRSRTAWASIVRHARRIFQGSSQQHGSGLVETAVALPIFFVLLFGAAQYAIVLLTYCNATYACRLAARYASMHSSASLAPDTVAQVKGLVTSRLFVGSAITPTVSVNYLTMTLSSGSNIVGDVVEVSVSWTQTLKVPFMSPSTFSIGTQDYRVITR
jgi:Flp pilus assembly protein TadG